jgi:hypothetical protein
MRVLHRKYGGREGAAQASDLFYGRRMTFDLVPRKREIE